MFVACGIWCLADVSSVSYVFVFTFVFTFVFVFLLLLVFELTFVFVCLFVYLLVFVRVVVGTYTYRRFVSWSQHNHSYLQITLQLNGVKKPT